jgi:hypothetical protein
MHGRAFTQPPAFKTRAARNARAKYLFASGHAGLKKACAIRASTRFQRPFEENTGGGGGGGSCGMQMRGDGEGRRPRVDLPKAARRVPRVRPSLRRLPCAVATTHPRRRPPQQGVRIARLCLCAACAHACGAGGLFLRTAQKRRRGGAGTKGFAFILFPSFGDAFYTKKPLAPPPGPRKIFRSP